MNCLNHDYSKWENVLHCISYSISYKVALDMEIVWFKIDNLIHRVKNRLGGLLHDSR